MIRPTYDQIKTVLEKKGFAFYRGNYNLNLVGIRSTRDLHANTFNDLFCVAFDVSVTRNVRHYPCTTDPGLYYRQNPLNERGAAILPDGQHRGLWQLGMHQGKYPALVQRRPVTVIRDANGDDQLDIDDVTATGWFGINCHRATESGTSAQVDKWSAGCQVIASSADFNDLMFLVNRGVENYGNSFTYTLLYDIDFE